MPYIKRNLEKIVQEVTLEYPVILLADRVKSVKPPC